MNEYRNNIDLPNAKLATWLELCISDENYQIIVNLSCNKCLFSHDLSLDLYGHPYKVLIDYNALTSPFAHIGEEIHGDVMCFPIIKEIEKNLVRLLDMTGI